MSIAAIPETGTEEPAAGPVLAGPVRAVPWRPPRNGDWGPLSGTGLLVDDFIGASRGATVEVLVNGPSGNQWNAWACLVREASVDQCLGGGLRWEATYTAAPAGEPSREPSPTATAQPACPPSPSSGPAEPRPLAEIVAEATSLPGWIHEEIEVSHSDGRWHVRIVMRSGEHPDSGSGEPF